MFYRWRKPGIQGDFRGCFVWDYHGTYLEKEKDNETNCLALVYWDGIPKHVTNSIKEFAKARAPEAPPWRAPSK